MALAETRSLNQCTYSQVPLRERDTGAAPSFPLHKAAVMSAAFDVRYADTVLDALSAATKQWTAAPPRESDRIIAHLAPLARRLVAGEYREVAKELAEVSLVDVITFAEGAIRVQRELLATMEHDGIQHVDEQLNASQAAEDDRSRDAHIQ